MRLLGISAIALTLLAAAPASAEDKVLDLSTIPCHVFSEYNTDNGALIMTYVEAYYLDDDD
ncbi:MAG TPA: hypothetical protein VJ728_13520 [Candidatus Binataceae bacterium]|nr:hypothetical protein [Candidatus Binataceae bacterium]